MKSDYDLIVIGGGPAGMMAGLLFARAGCNVLVLEKHAVVPGSGRDGIQRIIPMVISFLHYETSVSINTNAREGGSTASFAARISLQSKAVRIVRKR